MKHTEESLNLTKSISDKIDNQTFHHHYHVLYDIANTYPTDHMVNYVEIGCYAGGSACLLLQRPNTNVLSIDLGFPIDPNVVVNNVKNLNVHNNRYTYVRGNSQLDETYNNVLNYVNKIDILFIDGDHSEVGARKDFDMYSHLVKENGYVIFDDYNDKENSPGVKLAVDKLVKTIGDDYEIIGTLPNTFGARPEDLTDGNCYILKKKSKTKIGIVIPTFKREDGKSIDYLTRSLTSIKNQTFKDYKVFLIGDRYEDNNEFIQIATSIIDSDKIYYENLPLAAERDTYKDKWAIWSYGGVNATNHGIDVAVSQGFEYICHLDHDDMWEDDHLLSIYNTINQTSAAFIFTKSKYFSTTLPSGVNPSEKLIYTLPGCGGLIHSSVCMNFKQIPLRYRDIFKETGEVGLPSDGELWDRVSDWVKLNNLNSFLINKTTCIHDEEGYSRI
jgi:hypothetical protein